MITSSLRLAMLLLYFHYLLLLSNYTLFSGTSFVVGISLIKMSFSWSISISKRISESLFYVWWCTTTTMFAIRIYWDGNAKLRWPSRHIHSSIKLTANKYNGIQYDDNDMSFNNIVMSMMIIIAKSFNWIICFFAFSKKSLISSWIDC